MKFKDITKEYNIPDKPEVTGTTSLKFKQDVFNFFYPQSQDLTIVEFGPFRGHFTQVLSKMFKQVYSIDKFDNHFFDENTVELDNVKKIKYDLYSGKPKPDLRDIDVVIIDAVHTYSAVISDTTLASQYIDSKGYIIYDDYGAFSEVRHAVDTLVKDNTIKILEFVGEGSGYSYREGTKLKAREGVIAQFV